MNFLLHPTTLLCLGFALLVGVSVRIWRKQQYERAKALQSAYVLAAVSIEGSSRHAGDFVPWLSQIVCSNATHALAYERLEVYMHLSQSVLWRLNYSDPREGVYLVGLTGRRTLLGNELPARIEVISYIKDSHQLSIEEWFRERPQEVLKALLMRDEILPNGDRVQCSLYCPGRRLVFDRTTGPRIVNFDSSV